MLLQFLFRALGVVLVVLMSGAITHAQDSDGRVQSDRLGITFIASADHPNDEARYRQALLLGAGWNRFPMYWQQVETSPDTMQWNVYDQVIASDLAHGLQSNVILLGIPEFYRDGASIQALDAPIFSDGTDTPAPGKTINPANHWAQFVYAAVSRYKPGGVMGADGVRVWEVWNEPDLLMFWGGSVQQYARMLKAAYLAAHHADPTAQVMFGGLAYINPAENDWLAATLAVIARDPTADANHWYMDKVAVHNYSSAWRSGWVVQYARDVLAHYGLTRPIWLNESGVPVWDDYPGPTWAAAAPDERRWRGTLAEQAAFVVQSTAYAWASGAEVVFFHQLYDDCGNQSAGTDFAPNSGQLGDAHGLFRNEQTAVCFRQSPMPGTPRPAASAFHLMAQVFGSAPFSNGTVLDLDARGTVIAFDRPTTGERIYVLWNESADQINLEVPASSAGADLYAINNQDWFIAPTDARYEIGLPPPARPSSGGALEIGGLPYILVEQQAGGLVPLNPALVVLEPFDPDAAPEGAPVSGGVGLPAGAQVFPTPGSVLGGAAPVNTPIPVPVQPTDAPELRPTVDPAGDTSAPIPQMLPLPVVSPPTFTVAWSARDDSGVSAYTVWVRVDGGEWTVWQQETSATTADYTGAPGSTVEFAVWARDLAGNWSLNTELSPQARTAVQ